MRGNHRLAMSLLPAYFGPRKGVDDDQAPATEPDDQTRADIFNLIPPHASDKYQRPAQTDKSERPAKSEAAGTLEGRNVHAINTMDLPRLLIDNDGRLYWDGKPVEVRRRLMMSRGQAVGADLIAFSIFIGALGSAVQAMTTVHDWACRNGWASRCAFRASQPPTTPRPSPRFDIPA